MKRVQVGLTALTAATAVFGQDCMAAEPARPSSVQIYGVADVALAHYQTSGSSGTKMQTGGSGSRIGFFTSEGLSDGWRVNTRLEAGFNMNSGTKSSTGGVPDRLWSRQAYVELENKALGGVRLGRLQGPTYNFFPKFDPMLVPAMDAWGVLTTLGAALPGYGSGTGVSSGFLINPTMRTQNTIAYMSPSWRGLQAEVAYSFSNGSSVEPALLEVGLDYRSGPLAVGLLFVHADSTSGAGTVRATKPVSEMAIGAKYDFGPFNPYVTYIHRNLTDQMVGSDGAALNTNSESVKLVGAVVPVSSRGNIRITYGRYSSGSPGRDAKSYGLAYTYDVNPRLMLMVAATRLTQQDKAKWPVFQSPRPDAGASVNGVITGMTWRF
ncbi:porin [Bordetella avium]|uniref:Outer membrane porin n=1 Tax=Bordetella avium (strain 197N) TaxID=360910 RepID=Q2KXT9_BORA1|nr:porin [Bordetella avium]AZY48159.1 porin [Bordetella avium]AZY51539.1 porin [Bordetella avium]RIQ16717.1 porin [Bordetella avium]RIQ35051.1 porin [Bordetella avium]RIQ49398.1 porin [Bordetella avium]